MEPVKSNRESLLSLKSRIFDFIRNFDLSSLAWFPFIGWFIPVMIKKDDELYMFHARRAFVLAIYVIAACTLLYLLAFIFIPSWMDIVRFIVVIIIYVHYVLYAAICVLGTMMLKKGEKKEFPFIGIYVSKAAALLNL